MLISESYKKRLQQLAGIKPLDEIVDVKKKNAAMDKSVNRVKYSPEMLKQAIEQGREIGMNFQSNNKKYKMPTVKARIVWPVALGVDKDGAEVFRGYHTTGQSEKKALQTGSRTAEAENEWRLFKTENIKSMWFTDEYFSENLPGYKSKDSAMVIQSATYSPAKARKYQITIKKQPPVEVPIAGKTPITKPIEPAVKAIKPITTKTPAVKQNVNKPIPVVKPAPVVKAPAIKTPVTTPIEKTNPEEQEPNL